MASSPERPSSASPARRAERRRWGLAAATAIASVALRVALQPLLGDALPFLVAFPAMAFAAALWGAQAGLVVAAAGALAVVVPALPPYVPFAEQPLEMAAYFVGAVAVCFVSGGRVDRCEDDAGQI